MEEAAWLNDNPVIRVAVAPDRAPIEFTDTDGIPQGITVEYLKWIEKTLPIEFDITTDLARSEALEAVHRGDIHLLTASRHAPDRTPNLIFTEAYLSVPIVVFAGPDASYIGDLAELNGSKVAVLAGDASEEILANDLPDIGLDPVDSMVEALQRLARGQDRAFIGDLMTTSHYLGELGLTQIKVVGETPYRHDLALAVHKDRQLLATIMQKALATIPKAERNAMRQRWISFRFEQGFDYSLLWKILIPLLLIAAIIVYWNRRLANEVGLRRNAEHKLEAAIDNLQQKNKELDAYSHTIAHSLKTPLAASIRFLEILSKFKADNLSEEQSQLANQALSTLGNTGEVVDDLLMLSTVSSEQIELKPLDMNKLVNEALKQLARQRLAPKADVQLPEAWLPALGHAPWVGEIWLNYLSNAFKYGEPPVKLELGSAKDGADRICFWVRDNGRPLTEDERARLFVPFSRLHHDLDGGHGLGLTIVQRIADKLGGTAGVDTPEAGGNRFFFTLPIVREVSRK
jgi:signal transduction histidine kinase